jgi:hypothetical protein
MEWPLTGRTAFGFTKDQLGLQSENPGAQRSLAERTSTAFLSLDVELNL